MDIRWAWNGRGIGGVGEWARGKRVKGMAVRQGRGDMTEDCAQAVERKICKWEKCGDACKGRFECLEWDRIMIW